MDIQCAVTPAQSLPSGWNWNDWDDGSGGLYSPNQEDYFSYDLTPYHSLGGIEYKETTGVYEGWNIFWGSLPEFKRYAEFVVRKEYL